MMLSPSTLFGWVLVLVVSRDGEAAAEDHHDTECTSNGHQQLFLREPLTHLLGIPPDNRVERLLSLQFPIPDIEWIMRRWVQRGMDQQNVSDVGASEDPESVATDHSTSSPEDRRSWPITPRVLHVTRDAENKAVTRGMDRLQQIQELNHKLHDLHIGLPPGSPAETLQKQFRYEKKLSTTLSKSGYVMIQATKEILESPDTPAGTTADDLQMMLQQRTCLSGPQRPKPEPCDPSYPYRRIDGTCNNLKYPIAGSAFTRFIRKTQTQYGDGVSSLRKAMDGQDLPSARLVSTTINNHPGKQSSCFSVLQMTFGQFMDHDLTSAPLVKGLNGSSIPCCIPEVQANPDLLHPECAAIKIPKNDHFYAAYGWTCMEFVRSLPAYQCTYGHREQLNELTAYIDGSAVYGSHLLDPEVKDDLRTYENGLLVTQVTQEGMEMLAPSTTLEDQCNTEEHFQNGLFCFRSGDSRVNENVLLVIMTTVFARQHNIVAKELKLLNPEWTDEILYQEARRIVGAILQQVTYNEFLRGVLGTTLLKGWGLEPQGNGVHTTNYNSELNPGISNEFAVAAFRFGHTLIPDNFYNVEPSGSTTAKHLNFFVFNPFSVYSRDETNNLVRGGQAQGSGGVDLSFSHEIAGQLFKSKKQVGLDLISINIQRGRDHGVGSYVNVRLACDLPYVSSFDDLAQEMRPTALSSIKKLYRHVLDIDLFVGGLAELPLPGAQIGPTFACIIGDQFLRLKIADRFWFEYRDGPGAFTVDQLRELHKASLARLLCDTLPELNTVLRWPLQLESAFNPNLSCSSACIPKLNFSYWKVH